MSRYPGLDNRRKLPSDLADALAVALVEPDPTPGVAEVFAKGVERFSEWLPRVVWRYRRELRPMFAAVVLWSHLSLVIWAADTFFPSIYTFLLGAAATGAAAPFVIREVIRRRGLVGAERAYVIAVGSPAACWAVLAWIIGSFNLPMGAADLLLGTAATIPWVIRLHGRHGRTANGRVKGVASAVPASSTKQRPVREIVRTAAEVQALKVQGRGLCDHLALACRGAGLGAINVMSAEPDQQGSGWTFRVQAAGLTVDGVNKVLRDVESHLDDKVPVRIGALSAYAGERSSQVIVRFLPEDPLSKLPPAELSAEAATITEPLLLGSWDDLSPVELLLEARHALVGGMTGAGKSKALRLVLYRLGMCRDVVLWGIDLKAGIELTPWSPRLDRLATTAAEAHELLKAARTLMDQRGALVAAQGFDAWPTSPEGPVLVVVVDEFSQLEPESKKLAEELSQLGRACGVQLLIATQKPLASDVGSVLPSQCTVKICLHCANDRDGDVILGGAHVSQGWRASRIGSPGYFLGEWPEHQLPQVGRFALVDDVREAVALTVAHRPGLQLEDQARAAEPGDSDPPAASSTGPATQLALPDQLLQLLEERRPLPVRLAELVELTGAPRSTLHAALRTLEASGRAERARRGAYRAGGLV